MGLIRKSFALGTAGIVSPSSKKQRVAKATKNEIVALRRQEEAIAQTQRTEEMFRQLPPEGKAEYRRIEADFAAARGFGFAAARRRNELVQEMRMLWRQYDLIP
jgi:hypothetical protein